MNKYLKAALYALLFYAFAFLVECLGFIGPFFWVYGATFGALVLWFPYSKLYKTLDFGAALLPAIVVVLINGVIGELDALFAGIALGCAVLAELARKVFKSGGYVASYTVFSLIPYASTLRMWMLRDASYPMAVNEMGVEYADRLMAITPAWACPLTIVTTMIVAALVASVPKFWNNASRPSGRMGRLMIRFMNFSHTPSAHWNLSQLAWGKDWTVLDNGCGGGENIKRLLKLCPEGKIYGVDISEESVRYSQQNNGDELGKRCFISQAGADKLPFGDGSFDAVTAYETIFFWPSLDKCLSEIYRVLKPGGVFTFDSGVVDNKTMQFFASRTKGMHLRSKSEFESLLEKAGFSRTESSVYKGESINFRAFKSRTEQLP